jgi:hypothetical protein
VCCVLIVLEFCLYFDGDFFPGLVEHVIRQCWIIYTAHAALITSIAKLCSSLNNARCWLLPRLSPLLVIRMVVCHTRRAQRRRSLQTMRKVFLSLVSYQQFWLITPSCSQQAGVVRPLPSLCIARGGVELPPTGWCLVTIS